MKYDDASWHFESTPDGTDEERWLMAAAHIGIYLRLCFDRGWASDFVQEDFDVELESVRSGTTTGSQFIIDNVDCKFVDDLLSEEGNLFTTYYYNGHFNSDIETIAVKDVLSATEEEYNFTSLKKVVNDRYEEWITLGRPPKRKAWWKLW